MHGPYNSSSAYYAPEALLFSDGLFHACQMAIRTKRPAPVYFREWRKYRELTQEQAAERAKLSQETLSRLENRKIGYTESNLAALAYAYRCEPHELLRPPNPVENEFAAFVMALDAKGKARALRLLKALRDEEEAA